MAVKNNTTKAKINAIKKIIAEAKKPLILIYSCPDPDSLASAWALQMLMSSLGNGAATIGYTGNIGRLENETMINLLKIPAQSIDHSDIANADLIALVDAQPEFFKDLNLHRCDLVFDHHPKKSKSHCLFEDIRTHCLATSSVLMDYLLHTEFKMNKRLATALFYGIITDSHNLQKSASREDLDAIHFLETRVDRNVLHRIEFSSYSLHRLDYFSVALNKLQYANNVIYCDLGTVPASDILPQIADFLIRVKEAQWAVVSGVVEHELVIVFRCDGYRKNAGEVAEKAFDKIGSAGGHRTMARAEILDKNLPEDILLTQNEKIENFILKSLARVDKSFNPLFQQNSKQLNTL